MGRINAIQNAILELDGGTFQKLLDAYLYKKYKFDNIHALGMQTGTNKVTKGVPDSFVVHEDDTYTLIMYGSVQSYPYSKLKDDILSCFDPSKLDIEKSEIKNIICAYTSTNLHLEQIKSLENLIPNVNIKMIGISTISHDLLTYYPTIAADFLQIPLDTGQILKPKEFLCKYDQSGMNAPLSVGLTCRSEELKQLKEKIDSSKITLVSGQSGIGKTRLVIEACKEYEEEDYEVFCIKNNGLPIYDDIRFYFSDPGNYVLFIDDANETTNLEYIFDYVSNQDQNINIKLIVTVRDYAKQRLIKKILNYFYFNEMVIKPLDNDAIKNILVTELGIENDDYLKQIVKIAKGNPRLAILAGQSAINKGYKAINNVEDIFKNYYGEIVDTQNLDEESVNIIFIISLLGAVRIQENQFALDLLKYFDISDFRFLTICHQLNEKELVDLYHDEVVKISDQSLGNYILEYMLIEKKGISIVEILKLGFPDFKNKIIYALNTLMSLFHSDENQKYIEEQINKSWDTADLSLQEEYLYSFYQLNKEKSLQIIKRSIDEMDIRNFNLKEFNFEKQKRHIKIKTPQIEILSRFKYSDYYKDSIELLLYFIEKRPDLIMDFYFVFSDRLSFDKYSHKFDYVKEYMLVETIWDNSKQGENEIVSFLLLVTLKELLNCHIQITESGESNKSVNWISFPIVFNEGTKRFRYLVWNILSKLYNKGLYKKEIESILSTFHGSGLNDEQFLNILKYDMECIKILFIDNWDKLSFEQCYILKSLKEYADRLAIDYDSVYEKYKANNDFMIYCILSKNYFLEDWKVEQKKKRDEISALIKKYEVEDFCNFFGICYTIEKKNLQDNWSIGESIREVFSLLDASSKYVEIVKIYFLQGAPYSSNVKDKIIARLIKIHGVDNTNKLIQSFDFEGKRLWECNFWESIPASLLREEHVKDFIRFLEKEKNEKYCVVPSVLNLRKYYNVNNEVVAKVSEIVIEMNKRHLNAVSRFLNRIHDDNDIEMLLSMYSDNINLLKQMYIQGMTNSFDYRGNLLIKLVEDDFNFWDDYIKNIIEKNLNASYFKYVFQKIWSSQNYHRLITIAFDNFTSDPLFYMNESQMNLLFSKQSKEKFVLIDRQKNWINDYIANNHYCIASMKKIFELINSVFEDQKLEFFMEFLKNSKKVKDFKEISLFPSIYSWSGSEVPLHDSKILFLEGFIRELKGIEFIEHRAYLKKVKQKLENARKEIQVREYLEENDLA